MRFVFVLLLSLVALPAFAGPAKTLDLGDNVQVWFQEDHTVPLVALSISLPAGSAYDAPGKDGLAAFAAYLLNEGAGAMRSDAYQAALADKAIVLSMTPDRDYLVVSIATQSSNLKEALRAGRPRAAEAAHGRRRRWRACAPR